ncbi:DUF1798 family protein [Oceanobacillus sp. 143]|uniref:DUF1798 domain-containing protein n=1 Tax=Oceanobacillus zhaokaii TaxID=2052660 RepID=A0A345PH41_9BACI|nr:DUF1798 family protein [Oceanobacillus zhaokaii]AXI09321.1 DUF1798 domain-containing protein [Oceanobacillus zhaokaii]QGS68802.1 DUF1798 family protein [Oceanobacillus sp. 143]
MELLKQTETLREHLDYLRGQFEHATPPENVKDRSFFEKVKEETTPIYDLIANWEENALQKVKEQKVTVHPQQITSTKENMELLLMHSYYKDARRKRYMELYNSVIYIYDQIIREL